MEIKTEIKTYKIKQICDRCRQGEMTPDNTALMSDPPRYPHTCDFCGHKEIYLYRYPRIVHSND